MVRPTRLVAVLSSLFLLGSVLGAPATLAVATAVAASPLPVVGGPAVATSTSTYYSGYSVYLWRGSFSRVTGTWVVPKATCNGTTSVMFSWVGIDDNGAKYLEQAGTADQCLAGSLTPSYYAWYEMFPKTSVPSGPALRAGDRVRTTVTVSGSTFTFKIENLTRNLTFTKAVSQAHSARLAAYWIVESPWAGSSPASIYPLTQFSPFSLVSASATANGHSGSISSSLWNLRQHWTMASGRTLKATAGGLTYTGSAFAVTWHHR